MSDDVKYLPETHIEVIVVNLSSNHFKNITSASFVWQVDVIQRVVTLAVIMVVALIGNILVLLVLGCFSRYNQRHTRVNIFIVNLAVGDLSVCFFTMVTEILFVAFGDWIFGNAGCKLVTYLQIVTLAGTTFILTSMGFDRYLAICKPLSLGTTNSRAKKMIAICWIAAFIFATPQLFIFRQVIDVSKPYIKYACKTGYTQVWQRKTYFTFLTTYILVIPAILISFCYINVVIVVWKQGRDAVQNTSFGLRRAHVHKRSRTKIKTLKMTFAIIMLFISCWTPYFVATLIRVYTNNSYKIAKTVMVFVETIVVLPSALNPILYGFFNIRLARTITEACCKKAVSSPLSCKLKCPKHHSTECVTVSLRAANGRGAYKTKRHVMERSQNSSSGSYDKNRISNIITEENVNGIKLRVRFTPKENSYNSYSDNDDYKIVAH